MKKTITMMVTMAAGMALAQPGFKYARFVGSEYDGAGDIWANSSSTVLDAAELYKSYGSSVNQQTTHAYGAYMFLEGGVTCHFKAWIDDFATVKIDDILVVPQTAECAQGYGTITFQNSGWHKIELRVSNNGGPSGSVSGSSYCGIYYSFDRVTWNRFVDSGSGTLFVTVLPEGESIDSSLDSSVSASYDGLTFSISSDISYAILSSVTTKAKVVNVPDNYYGIPVKSIGGSAFKDNLVVQEVVLPETVTTLGDSCFKGCVALSRCNIPTGVTEIPNNCFNGCSKLGQIELPSGLKSIGSYAFSGCALLADVMLPDGLEVVNSYAFQRCTSFSSAILPDTVTSIGGSVFRECSSITTAKLPSGYSTTSDALFMDCTSLETVTLPIALERIENHTFRNCSKLLQFNIPNSVTYIGDYAFWGCQLWQSVTIPDGIESIKSYSFANCSSLKTVNLPDGLVSIGSYAFVNDSQLENITIPDSVIRIDERAFQWCAKIKSIHLPEGLAILGNAVFEGNNELVSINIPNGIMSIGEYMFQYCYNLKSLAIPDSVTSIGRQAFRECTSLREMALPHSVKTIAIQLFDGCTSLESVTFAEDVTSFGEYAFRNCPKLTSVKLPAGLTSIPTGLFQYCYKLYDVEISAGVTSIGAMAFEGTAIDKLILPSVLETIGYHAFNGCKNIQEVIIPESLSKFCTYHDFVPNPAFNNCTGLKKVVFEGAPPENVANSWLFNRPCYTPKEYGAQWLKVMGINNYYGSAAGGLSAVKVISSKIRENDPTIMDVVYKVTSSNPTVKVRALAFEDGERSFTKVVRPETFIEGTSVNVGDNIAANVEHTLSWQVSSDWQTRLAKLKFEVLACEGELLPMEWMTIPASDSYGKMKVSWNAHSESQIFDALLWLYADKNPGLTLANGGLRNSGTLLASGVGTSNPNAIRYIYLKMGYNILSGSALNYVNDETRLGLSPSGVRQYAFKIVGDAQ